MPRAKPMDEDTQFDVYSNNYDPIGAVEGSDQPPLPEDDGELNVGSLSTSEDEPPAEDEPADEPTEDEPTEDEPADDESVEDEGEATEETPTDDEPPAEDELVPGVDPELARRELKEKTQQRIQTLAKDNKELTNQLDTFRRELDELKRQQPQSGQTNTEMVAEAQEAAGLDLKPEAIRQMFDKALDGDLDTASQQFLDMMQSVATNATKTATSETRRTLTAEQQQEALDQTAAQLEADYSVLDSKSDDFNEPLAREIVELRDFYIRKGEPYADALTKAARMQLTAAGLWEQESILNDAPAPTQDTTAAATTRNQEAARTKAKTDQPPAPAGKTPTAKNPGKSIMDLSDAEFDAMTDAELAKLTGTQYS